MNKHIELLNGNDHGSYLIAHELNTEDLIVAIYFGRGQELYNQPYRITINNEHIINLNLNRPTRDQDLFKVVIIG